jgi:hypothetical protein
MLIAAVVRTTGQAARRRLYPRDWIVWPASYHGSIGEGTTCSTRFARGSWREAPSAASARVRSSADLADGGLAALNVAPSLAALRVLPKAPRVVVHGGGVLQPRALADRQEPHGSLHDLAARDCVRPSSRSARLVNGLPGRGSGAKSPNRGPPRRSRRHGLAPSAWRVAGRPFPSRPGRRLLACADPPVVPANGDGASRPRKPSGRHTR